MSGTHRLYIDLDSSRDAKRLMRVLQEDYGHGWHIDYIPEGGADLHEFQTALHQGRLIPVGQKYAIESVYNKAGRIIGYRRKVL